jgi:hypothetical protein
MKYTLKIEEEEDCDCNDDDCGCEDCDEEEY